MTISAKVIADSVSTDGVRITTFELEYPRFIHAEFMTHRHFSRNAASSRAIPVKKVIEHVLSNPAMPIHWGKNQSGMQAAEEHNDNVTFSHPTDDWYWDTPYITGSYPREDAWDEALVRAVHIAQAFADAGYHKQVVNRLLEPFAHIKVVCTATEYDNFFYLRRHKDAQPEIRELADRMWEARNASTPVELRIDDWHVPYYKEGYLRYEHHDHWEMELELAQKISASCCAQISYRKSDDSPEKADRIYNDLVDSKPVHASPFEHQATPIRTEFQRGCTHTTRDGHAWSGNFRGWIQYRQLVPENTCYEYRE